MDENRLDGNAAAGLLAEIFTLEITTARTACVRCGAAGEIGGQMAYVSEIGTVVRCAACDNALIRVVRQEEGPQEDRNVTGWISRESNIYSWRNDYSQHYSTLRLRLRSSVFQLVIDDRVNRSWRGVAAGAVDSRLRGNDEHSHAGR